MADSSRNPLTLARFELRRFKGPLPRLALAFILLIPMLYGCIYLAGNWDPYGRLDQVPVAIVNHDVPTTVKGKEVAAGRDFVDSLHRTATFDFVDASAADAERGLERGDFYLVITVPETFSRDLVSAQDLDPRRAGIELRRNDANGFVIGTITNSAQNSIARAIDETAVRSYFEAVFANLDTIRDGMLKAADGAARLDEGLATAREGSSALAEGLGTLDDGAAKLSDGAGQVADGTRQLADTVDPLLTTAAERLPEAQEKVQGAADLAAGLTAAVADDADRLNDVAATMADDLDDLVAEHPDLADDPAIAKLTEHATTLAEFTSSAADKAGKVADDVATADERLRGLGDLSAKAEDAKEKVDRLRDGAAQVSDGADALHAGTTDAKKGAEKLDDGLARIADGAHELATELGDGAARIPALTADERDDAVSVMSAPVDVTMEVDNPAHVYGRGLAPMFFSIALWVFGISAFFLLRPITGRMLAARGSDLRIAVTAWATLAATSVVASWIMLAVAWVGLGLDPAHPWLIIMLTTLVALAFSAVAHLMRTWLGLVATAAMLVLLIIQLTAAGGTYPPELLPPVFASLGHFMPMRYSIEAFRIAISGGLMSRFWFDVTLLALLLVSAIALLLIVVHRRRRFSMKDLHPPFG
ncbi:MAG TPA: YhgE/Pip domain-containing protein [Arachnia sp.]|jgi:putative membrane protein|nr:YhgE/Pip domain-containing protein [Arachnia sp.]